MCFLVNRKASVFSSKYEGQCVFQWDWWWVIGSSVILSNKLPQSDYSILFWFTSLGWLLSLKSCQNCKRVFNCRLLYKSFFVCWLSWSYWFLKKYLEKTASRCPFILNRSVEFKFVLESYLSTSDVYSNFYVDVKEAHDQLVHAKHKRRILVGLVMCATMGHKNLNLPWIVCTQIWRKKCTRE